MAKYKVKVRFLNGHIKEMRFWANTKKEAVDQMNEWLSNFYGYSSVTFRKEK